MVVINIEDNLISLLTQDKKVYFFNIDKDIIQDCELKQVDKLKLLLSKLKNEYNLKNKQIILSLPEKDLLIREIKLPKPLSDRQLIETLPLILKKELPFNINTLYVNYILKEDKKTLVVYAINKKFIQPFIDVFNSLSLKIEKILFPSLGVNLYINEAEKNVAVLYLGYSYSSLVIFEGKIPVSINYFNIGLKNFQDMLNLTSEKEFYNSIYIHSDPIFYKWVIEVQRTLNSSINQLSLSISNVYIAGNLNLILYPEILSKYLKEKLNMDVECVYLQLKEDKRNYLYPVLSGFFVDFNYFLDLSKNRLDLDKQKLKEIYFVKNLWYLLLGFILFLLLSTFILYFFKAKYKNELKQLQELMNTTEQSGLLNLIKEKNVKSQKDKKITQLYLSISKILEDISKIEVNIKLKKISYNNFNINLEGISSQLSFVYIYIEKLSDIKNVNFVYLKNLYKDKKGYNFLIILNIR